MEERLRAVEQAVVRIDTKLDTLLPTLATKADVADAKSSIIMWVVGAIFLAQLLPGLLRLFGIGR